MISKNEILLEKIEQSIIIQIQNEMNLKVFYTTATATLKNIFWLKNSKIVKLKDTEIDINYGYDYGFF